MSMCRAVSCVAERGCLLWPVCSLGKTLLAFVLLHLVLQGQTCLLSPIFLDFLLLHSSPLWWKGHLCVCVCVCVCVLVIGGLHRTIQLQFLQLLRLGHRLGLLWYWMVWHGNELRSFCHFLRLHLSTGFQTLLLTMMATPFLLRDS